MAINERIWNLKRFIELSLIVDRTAETENVCGIYGKIIKGKSGLDFFTEGTRRGT
jgi:hypothetical protein